MSAVVPVYNAWPYLDRCARSITRQTLPVERYEAIFVDDGSTDECTRFLDDLAAAHPQVVVIHQANSGWPGKPRNVGLDAARGDYVFFCDADDWLAEDALADLCDFADANGSEIVLPKMAGVAWTVPHHVFRRTVRRTSLADGPLMESLTAHKLYRRSFLQRNDIRFPKGPRRLEDHYFVVQAYLLASVVSIYADHTCYTHVFRRQAEAVARWKTRVDLLGLERCGALLRLNGLGQQYEKKVDPLPDDPPVVRFVDLIDPPAAVRLGQRTVTLTLTEGTTGEQWPVPVTVHGTGLQVAFTADLGLETLAAAKPLAPGNWDVHVHYRVLGLGTRVRANLVKERTLRPHDANASTPSLQVRPVLRRRAVSVEVGVRRTGPITWPGRLRRGLRWRSRRLLRQIAGRSRP